MKKKVLGVFVSLLAVAMLALPMSAAYATKPIPVSGTFVFLGVDPPVFRAAGESDNVILTFSGGVHMWTGDISGMSSWDERVVGHGFDPGPPPTSRSVNTHGLYTIDATVLDSKSGTLYIEVVSNSWSPHPANWRIIGGTDDLANLHGQGTWNMVDGVWEYTGQIHFDP